MMAELDFLPEDPFSFKKEDWVCGCFLDDYQILEVINRGSFGVVYRALDKKNNEIVAMKEEFHGMSPSTVMEINILKSLPRHPNIVEFKTVAEEGSRVFVVMEYLKYDLNRLRVRLGRPFLLMEIKAFLSQILKGVRFLHDRGVMHRDLKPGNILFDERNQIKICDFGLSAGFGTYSGGVGTKWYRAPEVLMRSRRCSYTGAIDMWSVGCILAEFVLGHPLFRGRWNDAHQIGYIRHMLGGLRYKMDTQASHNGTTPLTPLGHHLLQRLLAYNPSNRISAAEALNHPWFKED